MSITVDSIFNLDNPPSIIRGIELLNVSKICLAEMGDCSPEMLADVLANGDLTTFSNFSKNWLSGILTPMVLKPHVI